jgi:hypothetical protein
MDARETKEIKEAQMPANSSDFDKSQVINIIQNPSLKLVFFGVHNHDSKNIGVNINYSKAKWFVKNAHTNNSALHGFDYSLTFALYNTQGEGWVNQLYRDSNNQVMEFNSKTVIEAVLDTLHREYTELGYVVVGTPKVKNKRGNGSNNKGWGKAQLINMKIDQIKDLVTRMLLGTGKTFKDLPSTQRNEIIDRSIMSKADLVTKADLFGLLQQFGYVL